MPCGLLPWHAMSTSPSSANTTLNNFEHWSGSTSSSATAFRFCQHFAISSSKRQVGARSTDPPRYGHHLSDGWHGTDILVSYGVGSLPNGTSSVLQLSMAPSGLSSLSPLQSTSGPARRSLQNVNSYATSPTLPAMRHFPSSRILSSAPLSRSRPRRSASPVSLPTCRGKTPAPTALC